MGKQTKRKQSKGPIRIIVGHRGWVHVGRIVALSPSEIVVERARCVRRWGTKQGLAFIAENGPQHNSDGITMLDAPGTLRIHPLAVMHSYDCAEDKWAAHLA